MLIAVTPSTTKSARTATLIRTMTVFERALCFTPSTSTVVMASTRNTAGTFTMPPSSRGADMAAGSSEPNTSPTSTFR